MRQKMQNKRFNTDSLTRGNLMKDDYFIKVKAVCESAPFHPAAG